MFLDRDLVYSSSRPGGAPPSATATMMNNSPPRKTTTATAAEASDSPTRARPIGRKPVPQRTQSLTHLCPHCGTGVEAIPLGSPNHSDGADTDGANTGAADGHKQHVAQGSDAQKQRQIEQLQQEVIRLSGKASAASDKLADYEDEIRSLQAQAKRQVSSSNALLPPMETPPRPHSADESRQHPTGLPTLPETAPLTASPKQLSNSQSTLMRATSMRFSNFLTRKSSSQSDASVPDVPAPDPFVALQAERSQRLAAESKLTQVNTELEELSATLFQQANEMVATERRERAEAEQRAEKRSAAQDLQLKQQGAQIRKLQERIRVLEERDKERSRRLEKLEKGMQRVGRIRGLLATGPEPIAIG